MSLHIIILSGMDAEDTVKYLKFNGFADAFLFENQICRFTKIIGRKTPVRVSVWVALNTKLTQTLLLGLKYRLKNILFIYNATKPLTLIRAKGWWTFLKNTDIDDYTMYLCSTIPETPSPNVAYDKIISHVANKFMTLNERTVPHYAVNLNKIFKQLLPF
jgi:hypothetical protein